LLEAGVAFACLASFAALIGSWRVTSPAVVGFAVPLLLVAIAGQYAAPTAIYIITVPLFLVALAIAVPDGAARRWATAAALVATLSYMIMLAHFVMQGVGSMMPYAAVLPFVIAAFAILPLWQPFESRTARLVSAVAAMLALGMALWVLLDPPADTVAVYAASA
jgi:hypothetical protein